MLKPFNTQVAVQSNRTDAFDATFFLLHCFLLRALKEKK